jgi:hypothetical protein
MLATVTTPLEIIYGVPLLLNYSITEIFPCLITSHTIGCATMLGDFSIIDKADFLRLYISFVSD